ncbi:hypothetical protein TTHERM_00794360 (macronuclear) [Tetrahymena thermophila SB210]|uniref:Uncharacterized protein n=1 Tax=Tetrahymena thermophila (strain SB210) TaxID=312017 RepID=Q23VZ5_TETTS|nr:hypothetical protein TTHERM_00794360 [Tetrahymena thermophila SB210]EAS00710.1 hypothetical protein TTHERM_00794360 [Tetrahymena thermophila SB210]|eukprot:XP_001020955.1 hypothetical protein TTHERM_00794360 [Tetrahymena thermophila SB210]
MFRNIQKFIKNPYLRKSSSTTSQPIQREYFNRSHAEYTQALDDCNDLFKEVFLGIPKQALLIENCVKDKLPSRKILEYGEQALWDLYANKDFLNTIRCGEILFPYIEEDISLNHMSVGYLSLLMAESYINQNLKKQALQYLKKVEDCYFQNIDDLEEEPLLNYQYTLQLSELFYKIQNLDKSIIYATLCLQIQDLEFEKKITPCFLLCQHYLEKNNQKEALSFGLSLLKEVTFSNLINSFSPKEINSLCEMYQMVIDLLFQDGKDMQKAFVIIEEYELLLQIIKCQDQQILKSLNNKKQQINKSLKKQEDLLFVLGYYGQKLKLEQQSFDERHNLNKSD